MSASIVLEQEEAQRRQEFQESLAGSLQDTDDDRDQYLGTALSTVLE